MSSNPFLAPSSSAGQGSAPASEPVPVVLASRFVRFWARMIDLAFLLAAASIVGGAIGIVGAMMIELMAIQLTMQDEEAMFMLAAALGAVPALLVQAVLITWRGQSIGKMLTGTRIELLNGQHAGFLNGFLAREGGFHFAIFVPFGLLLDSVRIFREDHRCWHDVFGGTRVVVGGAKPR